MAPTREEALRAWVRSFRGWLTLTLVLTAVRLLSDLLLADVVFGVPHRWPGSGQFFRDGASDLLGSACLVWVLRYPVGAWLVLFATDLLGTLAAVGLMLWTAITFHFEPPGWSVTWILVVMPRVMAVLAALWWVRRDTRRAATASD